VAPRHTPHATRQGHRRHHRKALRDRRHGEGNGRLDHEEEVFTSENATGGDQGGNGEGHPDELVPKLIQPFLKWGVFGFRCFDQGRNLAKFGRHAGSDDDPHPRATRNRRALKEHVGTVGEGNRWCERRNVLTDRQGFPRQRRLIRLESGGLDEAQIGGDHVPTLEHHDIAWDQLLSRNLLHFPGATDLGPHPSQAPQDLHGPHGVQLGVQHNHGGGGAAVYPLADGKR
jgi:hypothetical protein